MKCYLDTLRPEIKRSSWTTNIDGEKIHPVNPQDPSGVEITVPVTWTSGTNNYGLRDGVVGTVRVRDP